MDWFWSDDVQEWEPACGACGHPLNTERVQRCGNCGEEVEHTDPPEHEGP